MDGHDFCSPNVLFIRSRTSTTGSQVWISLVQASVRSQPVKSASLSASRCRRGSTTEKRQPA